MLKHAFVSAFADGQDATRLRPSNWGSTSTDYATNPTHVFDGGVLGALLLRDVGASDGKSWLAPGPAGTVLVGTGAVPAWSATPSLTSLTIGSGIITWDGSAAFQTDKEFRIASDGGDVALFGVNNTNPDKRAFATDSGADTVNRFTINVNGEHWWGTGSAALDTHLYRTAAGELQLNAPSGNVTLSVSSASATSRALRIRTLTEDRWAVYANATAESGANAGSDFGIARFDDNGTIVDTTLTIYRSNGTVALTGDLILNTGVLYFGAHAVSFGANNSAGAGYRLVRVPNV